jgi:hypothetical protein
MKNKNFKIWLRKKGLLCRKYEYKVPSKPKISHTIYPTENGKQYDRKGNEFYGIVKDN